MRSFLTLSLPTSKGFIMKTDDDGALRLLTVKEVAKRLGVSASTIYGLVSSGELPAHRIGVGRGAIRIVVLEVERYLDANRVEPWNPPARIKDPRRESRRPQPPVLKHLKNPK